MNVIKIILPFPPSVNRLWRTSKTGGVYKSTKYSTWSTHAKWSVREQVRSKQITGPFKLTINAVRPDKRQRDLDNLFKATLDCLQASGVITNDSNAVWLEAKWVEKGPECELILEEITDGKTV
jgi:crossover junction endodeoxyribonuclease RusA